MIVTVFSSKGGVGKTTVALNLAYELALKTGEVLLVDTDPQNSAAALMCCEFTKGLAEVLLEDLEPKDALKGVREGLFLLPAGLLALEREEEFVRAFRREKLEELLKRLEGFKAVVFDTPPGYAPQSTALLPLSDFPLAVFEPEPASFASFKVFEEFLFKSGLTEKLLLVLNKLRPLQLTEDFVLAFRSEAAGKLLAYLPYDETVLTAEANCRPVKEERPDAPFALAVEEAASKLLSLKA
ncbi:MAG: ParA family protein [Aquificae bacterium]|nr:ParA family protein [Aquificota bacterium]